MKIPEHLRGVLTPIHPKGWPFIAASLIASLLLGLASEWLLLLGLLVTAWMIYFFRDPTRVTPEERASSSARRMAKCRRSPSGRRRPEMELGDAPLTASAFS